VRILAIRGQDLASLAGEFAVELAAPPLADAGVLVISGPTGAGKSTLLDAMCLALFDRTPRLSGGRGGSAVGFIQEVDRGALSSLDPRCLLRRGASAGRAEVEFLGQDGRRYRATWRVRRARNRPTGRLQAQTLELWDLDRDAAAGGSTKTETLAAIERALGLDYEAFCRSVLLAQGEFASFLRAAPGERADLLEKLTGTELYGRISRAAHARAGEARRAHELLAAERDATTLLPDDDRAELARRRERLTAARDLARRAREGAAEAVRWYEALDAHAAREERARTERAAAEAAWADAAPLRTALAEAEAARPLREPLAAAERARASRDRAAAADGERAAERARAEAEGDAADAAWQTARDAAAETEARRVEREGELRAARALDVELAQDAELLAEAEAAAERAEAEAGEAEAGAAARAEARDAAAGRAEAAAAWLAERADVEPLAARWDRWEGLLEDAARRRERLAALAAERPALAEAAERTEAARAAAAAEAESAAAALARAEADLAAARAEGPADPRAERERVEARRLALTELAHAARRAAEAEAERAEAAARLGAERSGAVEAEARAREAAAAVPVAAAARAEAERALTASRAALDLDARRHELRPGEPCPLCGAREHPYADDLPPLARLVAEGEARVAALTGALEAARRDAAGLEAERAASAERVRAAAAQVTRAEGEGGSARAEVDRLRSGLGEEAPPADAAAAEAARVDAAERLAALDARAARVERASDARDAARDARDRASAALAAAEAEARDAAAALAAADREAADARAEAERLTAELAPAFEPAFDPAFDPAEGDLFARTWRKALARDPRGFLAEQRRRVEAWAGRRRERDAAAAERTRLAGEAEAARARAEERRERAGAAAAERARRAERAAARRAERAGLLEGRAADAVAAELDAAAAAAAADLEAARGRREKASAALAAAGSRRAEAAARRTEAESAAGEADAALAAALAEAGLSEAELRARLARGDAWLRETRAELAALERRGQAAAQALEIHAAQRAEHERRGPPDLGREAAAELLASGRERAERLEADLLEVAAALEADDRARARRAALAPRLAAARDAAEAVGRPLGAIGSHDGKKLRVFAQSLSLELLTERANAFLSELAPRYRLARVAGRDLDLEVHDRDMGDEVRPITSLSGGETFLVSLALALGLSALAARDAEVGSLFIDEGFGALDPRSQETALDLLDALQHGGRQVALISHVPGLQERIGVGVRVDPVEPGRSAVRLAGPAAATAAGS